MHPFALWSVLEGEVRGVSGRREGEVCRFSIMNLLADLSKLGRKKANLQYDGILGLVRCLIYESGCLSNC